MTTPTNWVTITPTGYVFSAELLLEDYSQLLLENDTDFLLTETDTWLKVNETQQVWTKVP